MSVMPRSLALFQCLACILCWVATQVSAAQHEITSVRGKTDRVGEVILEWSPASPSSTYPASTDVFRNGEKVGTAPAGALTYTDAGLPAGVPVYYQLQPTYEPGSGESGLLTRPYVVTTRRADGAFVLDGVGEYETYQLQSCDCGAMVLYGAIRGSKLYVATWSPGVSGPNDHFLFVSAQPPSASSPNQIPPWAKSGRIHFPPTTPFLGGESTNAFVGWFNAPASSRAFKAAQNSGLMEGEIDLVEAFGAIPPSIYLAAYAFATEDGGYITNGANSLREVLTATILDHNANGYWDRSDPADGFRAMLVRQSDGQAILNIPTGPGRIYFLDWLDARTNEQGSWVIGLSGAGQLEWNYPLPAALSTGTKLFRVRTSY